MDDPLDPRMKAEHAEAFFDLFGRPPVPAQNPRVETPETDPDLAPVLQPERTLVESLGDVVDDLRQLYTDFGARPYRVFSVVCEWSGGETGRGVVSVISEREFLPTPKVWIGGGQKVATAAGVMREGSAELREISPRYTEDDIAALFPRALGPAQLAFIEVRMDNRDGSTPIRRRYTVQRTPQRDALHFEWRVPLTSQEDERNRLTGELDPLTMYPDRMRAEVVT